MLGISVFAHLNTLAFHESVADEQVQEFGLRELIDPTPRLARGVKALFWRDLAHRSIGHNNIARRAADFDRRLKRMVKIFENPKRDHEIEPARRQGIAIEIKRNQVSLKRLEIRASIIATRSDKFAKDTATCSDLEHANAIWK